MKFKVTENPRLIDDQLDYLLQTDVIGKGDIEVAIEVIKAYQRTLQAALDHIEKTELILGTHEAFRRINHS